MNDSTATGASGLGTRGEVTTLEPDRRERQVARRSAETRAIVPSVEFAIEVDMDLVRHRAQALGCGVTALLVEAAAAGLSAVPRVNGAYRDGRFELYSRVNVAVIVDEDGVPAAPVVFDADTKPVPEIAAELADLRERASIGALTPAELSGATFTLSDDTGSDVATLTPLIVPTQAAALAASPTVLTLACDHRIIYRAHATAFLEAVKAHLEGGSP